MISEAVEEEMEERDSHNDCDFAKSSSTKRKHWKAKVNSNTCTDISG